MTVASLIEMLENGEEVTTPVNSSLLTILQATIDNNYHKFSVDIDVNNGQMKLKRRGDFERKTDA